MKKYIVVELQTMTNGAVANLVTAYDNRLQAESAYHGVLAAAALSDLPSHAAVLMDNRGTVFESWCYDAGVEEE